LVRYSTPSHIGNPVRLSRQFEEPILLPDGRKLLTFEDAANYISKVV
jgi:hypothetical protein